MDCWAPSVDVGGSWSQDELEHLPPNAANLRNDTPQSTAPTREEACSRAARGARLGVEEDEEGPGGGGLDGSLAGQPHLALQLPHYPRPVVDCVHLCRRDPWQMALHVN